jgi:HSP20 family protein
MADTNTSQQQQQRQASGGSGSAMARSEEGRQLSTHERSGRFGSPFDLVTRMAEEMDRMFDWAFPYSRLARRPSFLGSRSALQGVWSPRIETFQKGDRFIVRAELPGLKKDDIDVELTENALTIRGERHEEHEQEREGVYHSERQYGEFYRMVPLPEGVIAESAEASFRDGVLEVKMQAPPAEASRGRRLEIKDEGQKEGQRSK